MQVVFTSDSGQLDGGRRQDTGKNAGHQISLIAVGDGKQKIAGLDAHFFKDPRVAPPALDGLNIQAFENPAQGLGVLVNDHHVLFFKGQTAGNVEADLAGADNDDLQCTPSPCCLSLEGYPIL